MARAGQAPEQRRQPRGRGVLAPGGRSVPALYGALTAGLVAVVTVVASMVTPATAPSIAELGPSARERIEEARQNLGVGSGDGAGGTCLPARTGCVESNGTDPTAGPGSSLAVPPPIEVAAGRRCYGDPPRQTEDPQSPQCVFEIFRGDNGGATAPGVTATEIRVAVPIWSGLGGRDQLIVEALIGHFNLRYEFYGRRLAPLFVESCPSDDPTTNQAAAEDVIATKPFAAISWTCFNFATSGIVHQRLAEARIISIPSGAPGFGSDAVVDGFTWLVDPPLDERLRTGAGFVCRALNGHEARHAGLEFENSPRRFAVVVVNDSSGVRPDPGALEAGLRNCDADFDAFDIPANASDSETEALMLNLKTGGFTTVLPVSSGSAGSLYTAATHVGYFPEWMDLGAGASAATSHDEGVWAGTTSTARRGHETHAFGLTSDMRVRPAAEMPAMWALNEGGGSGLDPYYVWHWYEPLLVLASGVQGAGPNLTPETFAQALRSTQFPNPNAGGPPYWQQGIGFGAGDQVFHDDYAVWWWSEDAPSQTSHGQSGRGSFCYLDRGGRFTADSFTADADARLFSASEPCR